MAIAALSIRLDQRYEARFQLLLLSTVDCGNPLIVGSIYAHDPAEVGRISRLPELICEWTPAQTVQREHSLFIIKHSIDRGGRETGPVVIRHAEQPPTVSSTQRDYISKNLQGRPLPRPGACSKAQWVNSQLLANQVRHQVQMRCHHWRANHA